MQNINIIERFEHFIIGHEAGNHYSELNDPEDLEKRFIKEQKLAERKDREVHPIDKDYLEAMEYGMPPTCGIGIGIDRLVMLFANIVSIKEVILFPTLKTKQK